jgi:hypothetical protein
MEYVITSEQPFEEIEMLTVCALKRHGFVVQRTFSLHSATKAVTSSENPGYSVFMIYRTGVGQKPIGLITLYQRSGQTVINPVLTSPMGGDVDADLVAALVLGGLEFCVDAAGHDRCMELNQDNEDTEEDYE